MTKVSIIVPVYNTEKYLRKCLISLVNQTLHDIEIICVNDGSTDNSLAVLNEFAKKDARIKVIDKENEGQSAARNLAIQQAQGEFLGFVDSDDWVDLKYFEELYNTAKNIIATLHAQVSKDVKSIEPQSKRNIKNQPYILISMPKPQSTTCLTTITYGTKSSKGKAGLILK